MRTVLAALILAVGFAGGAAIANLEVATAPAVAAVTEGAGGSDETGLGSNQPDTSDWPEGNAWIVGFVVFVLAAVLIGGGRWWVRNRVGRVDR